MQKNYKIYILFNNFYFFIKQKNSIFARLNLLITILTSI
jgi:hypothetical protein